MTKAGSKLESPTNQALKYQNVSKLQTHRPDVTIKAMIRHLKQCVTVYNSSELNVNPNLKG